MSAPASIRATFRLSSLGLQELEGVFDGKVFEREIVAEDEFGWWLPIGPRFEAIHLKREHVAAIFRTFEPMPDMPKRNIGFSRTELKS